RRLVVQFAGCDPVGGARDAARLVVIQESQLRVDPRRGRLDPREPARYGNRNRLARNLEVLDRLAGLSAPELTLRVGLGHRIEFTDAMRARDLGVVIGEHRPSTRNAITDVDGVRVGHATLIAGDAIRTGVTIVAPPETPLFAGCHRLNGHGELTGLEWVRESGFLTTPIGITNTFSVGVVRDAIAAESADEDAWSLP